ncbi:hypothetical protein PA3_35170 [Acinetobacter pittii]|uniref:Uncharacterized protein n=1 Tax=Acinetobacter pittii TaxID=48296 RepID=A0A4Y3JBP3_ACIPI|nr:hypothetical protein [Acinetobacter pittii]GEA69359.1 hypothetical protein PA3_35170 [Acinetobacter pittii]
MSYIELNRKFSQLSSNSNSQVTNSDYSLSMDSAGLLTWEDLLVKYNRCVVLAEAGAGKTEEFKQQAKKLENDDKFSFFIRIEDIDNDFIESFEVGDRDCFEEWLTSPEKKAWFFLDSVDEARLEDPRAFQKAINKFARKIQSASHRCHIYISSRPYSWRYQEDEDLLNSIISNSFKGDNKKALNDNKENSIKVVVLSPLGYEEIESFCNIRQVYNIDKLMDEIKKFDLLGLAERPFDLENIIKKWNDIGKLGSRLDIIKYNIDQRLSDSHTDDRKSVRITFEKLLAGAERLAAAVILTGKASISVSPFSHNNDNLNGPQILPDWDSEEIGRLLESGIFNDIIYGAVRFRHRDIREFLAAQWFAKQLNGDNRLAVEGLFFKEQFGEKIITPSLRPILSWLIILDEKICKKVIKFQPEIAFESGDPSQLSSSVRKQFFSEYINRIAHNLDDRSMRDNDSISKIVNFDFEEEVLSFINKYFKNEGVIIFLGKIVWQAKLKNCISLLKPIALDQSRDIYSRRISIRAIMAYASRIEKTELWTKLNEGEETLNRQLIAELVEGIESDKEMVDLLILSLKKSSDYKKYDFTGLNEKLEKFVKNCDEELNSKLLAGIVELMNTEPFYERKECQISKKYAWLLKTAYRIIENLVESRSQLALEISTLELLINSTALEYHSEYSDRDEQNKLKSLVPEWYEFNDKLYWHSIALVRQYEQKKVTDDWRVACFDHFWKFNIKDFERLLGFIDIKELMDDKLIALNRAFMIYHQNDKPEWMLEKFKTICSIYPALSIHLETLINPIISDSQKKHEEKMQRRRLKQEEEKLKNTKARLNWIKSLKDNPERLSNSSYLLKGELTNDCYWLMNECIFGKDSADREDYTNWETLISEFGFQVASAYREAAMKFWRIYTPKLHSEEPLAINSTPYAVIFGLTGLQIESKEDKNFPSNLNKCEISHALRYLSWELNGFPSWLEKFYKFFPDLVSESVMKEVVWELETSDPAVEHNYSHILQKIFHHAPWLYIDIAPKIFNWLISNNKLLHKQTNSYLLKIILKSDLLKEDLSRLSKQRIKLSDSVGDKAWWFALFVDSEPENGIINLEKWLKQLPFKDATYAAQEFICNLTGRKGSVKGKTKIDQLKEVQHLKRLYSLMHEYIKPDEDILRPSLIVYSPGLRDDAQDARDLLFSCLKDIPCAETYYAIKDLSKETKDHNRRNWLLKTASNIALSCGDLEPWESEQLLQFEVFGNIKPKTHKELFSLALLRVFELKDWLENGDDSPWRTWQRVEEETEMRNLIASELRKIAQNKYSISQENELANSQRTDIRLENPRINSPVPIELKILDKNWTGPELCERLRNQLVGDYLREATSGCGIFLLVAQNTNKKWSMNGSRVGLNELEETLQNYWYGIASQWPTIDSIKVIVIDLNKRGLVCNT